MNRMAVAMAADNAVSLDGGRKTYETVDFHEQGTPGGRFFHEHAPR